MTETEKISYLKALMYIANYDDEINDKELNFFMEFGKKINIQKDKIKEINNSIVNKEEKIEDILKNINNEIKTELICDLITICYIDGDYSIIEEIGLRTVCENINFDEDKLKELEEIAKERIKVNKDPIKIFKHNEIGTKFFNNMKHTINSSIEKTEVVGKKIKKESKNVAHHVTSGVSTISSKLSNTFELVKKTKLENKILKEKLKTNNVSEKVKQKIILELNNKIKILNKKLEEEQERNRKNEELISILEEQINDLIDTKTTAEKTNSYQGDING